MLIKRLDIQDAMKLLTLLVVCAIGAVSGTTLSTQCDSGWIYVNESDKCIGLAEICPSGASPARISNVQENQAAAEVLINSRYGMANLGMTVGFLNGYSNWATDQPNASGSEVFIMGDGKWYTFVASFAAYTSLMCERPYVCEYRLNKRAMCVSKITSANSSP
ncbi:uncharacterized protein LOC141911231 [Tubulanus polymorphus]|uniref:uncharacterized protein LOC141911231 n=1 Tax=Tubulanus polymorphus TaxID=672921 RepID=UPI003DA4757A